MTTPRLHFWHLNWAFSTTYSMWKYDRLHYDADDIWCDQDACGCPACEEGKRHACC